MKKYWPMAILSTDNGPDVAFTSCISFEKAEAQFDIWEKSYRDKIAARWIDVVGEDGVKQRSMKRINMDYVKELWENFGDVPMNPETECIEKRWGSASWYGIFRPGTHREEIWKWFEETFDVSVAKDLMGMED